MKNIIIITFAVISAHISSLQGLENSIVPLVENFENIQNLRRHKYSTSQFKEIEQALKHRSDRIRLVTYNVLADEMDGRFGKKAFWKRRLPRVLKVIQEKNPDLIAVQELSEKQLNDLLPLMQETYDFYGYPRARDKECNGFFYRKNRFIVEMHAVLTLFDRGAMTNTLTSLRLKDKVSGKEFAVFNTHLPFSDPSQRELEIRTALKLMKPTVSKMPTLFVGDFNTFPHRLDLHLPFYDGDFIHRIITEDQFEDAFDIAILGHLGPLATYTNKPDSDCPFCGQGTPGVILDRIYVSGQIQVLVHAVQPATVEGLYPSDHFPVFIDFILK